MIDREALRQEALRVHARYASEVVEDLGFCPWAAPARRQGRVRTLVLFGSDAIVAATVDEARALSTDLNADIGLLVFPELALGRFDFQHFAARVRESYERDAPLPKADSFAIADFHPEAPADLGSPARLVPFIRRSPDPTLQLVRHSVLLAARHGERSGTRFVDAAAIASGALEDLQEGREPLHARVARENYESVQRLGVERVAAVFEDILRDRDRSYARLGLDPPRWSPLRATRDDA